MVWVDNSGWEKYLEIDEVTYERRMRKDAPKWAIKEFEKHKKARDPKRKIRVE